MAAAVQASAAPRTRSDGRPVRPAGCSARRWSPRPSPSRASPRTRSSGRPAAPGCAPCWMSGRLCSAAVPAPPRVRDLAVAAVQRSPQRVRQGPAGAFRPARGHPVRGQAVKAKARRRGQALATSTDWAPTATAFKRLMDPWREAGRASRTDDDALWARFKAAQDAFFAAKQRSGRGERRVPGQPPGQGGTAHAGSGAAAVTDIEAARRRCARSRTVGGRRQGAPRRPRADREGHARVEQTVRRRTRSVGPAATPGGRPRAEPGRPAGVAVEGLRADLAQRGLGNERRTADARAALEAREQWLAEARAGLQEFGS